MVNDSTDSTNQDTQLEQEAAVEATHISEQDRETVKLLTEKLSAALLNGSLKDDLVKQHAQVAEDAVAGWESAETEVLCVKQQLETAVHEKVALEAQVTHLDEALKECMRQLRQSRDEKHEKFSQVLAEKAQGWNLVKCKLEDRVIELEYQVEDCRRNSPSKVEVELYNKLHYLEKENSVLKNELIAQSEELEVRAIERDLSARAAETASRQHLDSITKIAKLEAECRKLRAQSHNSLSISEHKSTAASSSCVESLPDSHSDYTDQLSTLDIENHKLNLGDIKERQPDCGDSWANALIAELDRFKTKKGVLSRHLPSSSMELELMDDFLEMERQVVYQQNDNESIVIKPKTLPDLPNVDSELTEEIAKMVYLTVEIEQRTERMEAEKTMLEMACAETQNCFKKVQVRLIEAQMKLEKLEMQLRVANQEKMHLELQLNEAMTASQTMSAQIRSLDSQLDKERALTADLFCKCQLLEKELGK